MNDGLSLIFKPKNAYVFNLIKKKKKITPLLS
jgi:hypothetical protein